MTGGGLMHGRRDRRRASPKTLGRRLGLLAASAGLGTGDPGRDSSQGKGANDDGRALCILWSTGMQRLLIALGQGEEKGKGKGKGKSEEWLACSGGMISVCAKLESAGLERQEGR